MKSEDSDNSIAYMVAFCAILVIGFVLAWQYSKPPIDPSSNIAFANVGPISMQAREFTMRTSLALQSTPEDGEDVIKNRAALLMFLQATLENADPATLSSSDGSKFALLQKQLTEAVNTKFPKIKVQQVWITDFVTSPD